MAGPEEGRAARKLSSADGSEEKLFMFYAK